MSQIREDLGTRVPLSPTLAASLTRGYEYARAQGHAQVALEHVLLALTEDPDAGQVLAACRIDTSKLAADTSAYLGRLEDKAPTGGPTEPPTDPLLSAELTTILDYARMAARQSRRNDVTGAIVLAAIVGEGKSPAAGLLRAHGMTFEDTIRVIREPVPTSPPPPAPSAQPPQSAPSEPIEAPLRRDPHRAMAEPEETLSLPQTEAVLASVRERLQAPRPANAALGLPRSLARSEPVPERAPPAPAVEPTPVKETTGRRQTGDVRQEPSLSSLTRRQPQISSGPVPLADEPLAVDEPGRAASTSRAATAQPHAGHQPSAIQPSPIQPSPIPTRPAAHSRTPLPPATPIVPAGKWERPPGPPSGQPNGPSPGPQIGFGSARTLPASEATAAPAHDFTGSGYQPARAPRAPTPVPQQAPGGYAAPRPGYAPVGGGGQAPASPSGAGPSGPSPIPGYDEIAAMARSLPAPRPQGPNTGSPAPTLAPPASSGFVATREVRGTLSLADGQIVELLPARPRVGVSEIAEVRISKAALLQASSSLTGREEGQAPSIVLARAVSVRLRDADHGILVEAASPETQWLEGRLSAQSDPHASWRFTLKPTIRGRAELVLVVSLRAIGSDGTNTELALPERIYETRVGGNFGRSFSRLIGWMLAIGMGALLGYFAPAIAIWALTLARQLGLI